MEMFIVLDLVWSHFAGSGYIGKVFERPIIGCLYLANLSTSFRKEEGRFEILVFIADGY